MVRVFICEDNKVEAENLKKVINDTILIENLDFKIEGIFNNAQKMLNYLETTNEVKGIYFLDVDLKDEINGIQLAAKIRKKDPDGFIIFITTHGELSYLTFNYKVEALDYIMKDDYLNVSNKIRECLIYINEKIQLKSKERKNFLVKINDRSISIDFDKIIFFETTSRLHRIKLHATNRTVTFYGSMKDVLGKLDNRFIQCHRSYIINKNYIKEINNKDRIITMENDQECLVSTRLIKSIFNN